MSNSALSQSASSSSSSSHSDSKISASDSWVSRARAYQEAVGHFTTRFANLSAKKLVDHILTLHQSNGLKKFFYLDVASGAGATIWEFLKEWKHNADAVASAKLEVEVHATDFVSTMLDLLNAAIPNTLPNGISKICSSVLNMEELGDFLKLTPRNSVDVLNCCFGIMFPKNTEQVLTNFYEVLSPNGVGTIVTWHYTVVIDIIESLARAHNKLSENDHLQSSLDFLKFGNESTMRSYLRKAGFKDAALEFHFESIEDTTSANALVNFLKSNPVYSQYFEDEAQVSKVMNQLQQACGKDGHVVLRATAVTIVCTKK